MKTFSHAWAHLLMAVLTVATIGAQISGVLYLMVRTGFDAQALEFLTAHPLTVGAGLLLTGMALMVATVKIFGQAES